MWFKIALRNIFRNRGRSGLSVLMIAGAVCSIVLFRGFSGELLFKLQKVMTESQYGHIQFSTKAFWEAAPGPRKNRYIQSVAALRETVLKNPAVISDSATISAYGLLSSGELTVSAKMVGIEPSPNAPPQSVMILPADQRLTADSKFEAIVGAGLAKQLGVKPGDMVTALSHTLDGVMNAVDLNVKGVYRTGVSEVDNNVFFLPLSAAQILLDTPVVDQLTLRIKDMNAAAAVRDALAMETAKLDPSLVAKTWYEQADLYRQTEAFYKVQNRVISAILLSLILLGIMNIVGMSIFERTGEIGTIRALGTTERSVVLNFLLEGGLLGVFGLLVGYVLSVLLVEAINASHLVIDIPGASVPIPIVIRYIPSAFVEGALISIVASTLASWIPSLRAAKIPIVAALRRNI